MAVTMRIIKSASAISAPKVYIIIYIALLWCILCKLGCACYLVQKKIMRKIVNYFVSVIGIYFHE